VNGFWLTAGEGITLCAFTAFPSFNRLIAVPLAEALGVRDKNRKRASHNPVLEEYYKTHSKHPIQVTSQTQHLNTDLITWSLCIEVVTLYIEVFILRLYQ